MGKIFNLEGRFYRFLEKFVNCILLSLMWMICCIPVVTIGTANTALYYTVNKVIRNDRGYIWSEFISAFKKNLKQSVILWLICLFFAVFMTGDLYVLTHSMERTGYVTGGIGLFLILLIVELALVLWMFPYIARFEGTKREIFSNSFVIAITNLFGTVTILALFAACLLILYFVPPLLLLVPAVFVWLSCGIQERIFRKYMSEEDKILEDERNGNYPDEI